MSLTRSGKDNPVETYAAPPKNDRPMVTLGLAVAATLLVVAVIMFSGAVLDAAGVVNAAIYVFVVAFATAPLFARLQVKWATQAAVLGSIFGWALSAPLEGIIAMVTNTQDNGADPFTVLPTTWLFALVPLLSALGVAMTKEIIVRRERY